MLSREGLVLSSEGRVLSGEGVVLSRGDAVWGWCYPRGWCCLGVLSRGGAVQSGGGGVQGGVSIIGSDTITPLPCEQND